MTVMAVYDDGTVKVIWSVGYELREKTLPKAVLEKTP